MQYVLYQAQLYSMYRLQAAIRSEPAYTDSSCRSRACFMHGAYIGVLFMLEHI